VPRTQSPTYSTRDESLSLDEGSVGEEPVEDPALAGEGESEGEEDLLVAEEVAVNFFDRMGRNLPGPT
jgi:hypothetical protein